MGAKAKSIHSQLSTVKGIQTASSGSSATGQSGGVFALNSNVVGNTEHVFAAICGMLLHVYESETNWPEIFVRAYIDDSLGERNWVDSSACKTFVENVRTAFSTKSIPQSQQHQQQPTTPSGGLGDSSAIIGTDLVFNKSEDDSNMIVKIKINKIFKTLLKNSLRIFYFKKEICNQSFRIQ